MTQEDSPADCWIVPPETEAVIGCKDSITCTLVRTAACRQGLSDRKMAGTDCRRLPDQRLNRHVHPAADLRLEVY